jgi:hypothetical protein
MMMMMMMILASLVVLHALLVERFLVMVGSNRWKLQYSIHHNITYIIVEWMILILYLVGRASLAYQKLDVAVVLWCFRYYSVAKDAAVAKRFDLGLEEKSM